MNDNETFSIRRIIYCEILQKQCIEDNKSYLPEDAVVVKCPSCEAYNNKEKYVNKNDFEVGDKVETTPGFVHYVYATGIEGIAESIEDNHVIILTDDESRISVHESSVQKLEE